ncbi:hypothetical protein B4U80_02120 [Leptotrombidium deliense]|uniref:Uncharacterized protein n=1 Tax=Leptotrombidium deliense TaxID=299467 RepID=A0A443SD58_9ACAR|nr:hypothetical protein B4U80_02120 [Leptotrombidium deliense]
MTIFMRNSFLLILLFVIGTHSFINLQHLIFGPLLRFADVEIGPPINGGKLKLGDGELVADQLYIYKCKICEMPRMFKMAYGSRVRRR